MERRGHKQERCGHKKKGDQLLGRLIMIHCKTAGVLLKHVLLSLAVGLERGARGLDRGIEILDRVSAFLADAIAELKTFHFANRSHVQSTVIRAAARGARRGYDLSGIVVLRGF